MPLSTIELILRGDRKAQGRILLTAYEQGGSIRLRDSKWAKKLVKMKWFTKDGDILTLTDAGHFAATIIRDIS